MKKDLRTTLTEALPKHIPIKAVPQMVDWMMEHNIHLTVTRPRKTKLGDYRPPQRGKGHRITVNGDLNEYSFLVTFIHEVAHLVTFNQYKNKVKPHGIEWKNNFIELMQYFFGKEIFPQDVEQAIQAYMINPAASSCVDVNLMRALRNYDDPEKVDQRMVSIEVLPDKHLFALPSDKRIFEKGPLLRKRFKCKEMRSGKIYTISAMSDVFPLKLENGKVSLVE